MFYLTENLFSSRSVKLVLGQLKHAVSLQFETPSMAFRTLPISQLPSSTWEQFHTRFWKFLKALGNPRSILQQATYHRADLSLSGFTVSGPHYSYQSRRLPPNLEKIPSVVCISSIYFFPSFLTRFGWIWQWMHIKPFNHSSSKLLPPLNWTWFAYKNSWHCIFVWTSITTSRSGLLRHVPENQCATLPPRWAFALFELHQAICDQAVWNAILCPVCSHDILDWKTF